MSPLDDIADRHPVVLFTALAFATSWTMWILVFAGLEAPNRLFAAPGAFGPAVAAGLGTRLRGDSVRAWLRETVSWRRSPRWYAVALLIPAGLSTVAGLGMFASTGTLVEDQVPLVAVLLLINVPFATILGGGQEEFGWRGFALPHLQRQYSALTASVIVAVAWTAWHIPMFVFDVYPMSPVLYFGSVVTFSVILTWLYNSSRACLPATILMHGRINATINVPAPLVGGQSALPVPMLVHVICSFGLVAAAIIVYHVPGTLSAWDAVITESADEIEAQAIERVDEQPTA